MTVDPGFDWSDVRQISVSGLSDVDDVWIDDVRISKADPDDSTAFNDTGTAWDFSGGQWHIYQDLIGIAPYSLGQISTVSPGTRDTALRVMPLYVCSNHFAAGIYLRDDGAASLLAYAQDKDNTYEVKLDSSANTVKLLRWISGSSTELASVSTTIDSGYGYVVGVTRSGDYIDVYLTGGSLRVFTSPTLIMHVLDTTYLAGRIGLASYDVGSRFFQVRAGSPEHALTAEYAFATDPQGHIHEEMPGPLKIGDVAGGNYFEIEADGSPRLYGTATQWDDLLPSSVSVGPGASAPSFTAYNGNLRAYEFIGTTTVIKELQMQWQLSHSWLEGSAVEPHLHLYVPNNASGGVIKFYCEYTWVNVDGVEGATTTISGTLTIGANAGNLHKILKFSSVAGTSKTLSSVLSARIYRDPADAADTFAASVWLKSADLHRQIDSLGSREEYIK